MKLRLFAVSGCIIFPCLVLAAQSPVLVSVSEEAHQDVHGRGKTVSIFPAFSATENDMDLKSTTGTMIRWLKVLRYFLGPMAVAIAEESFEPLQSVLEEIGTAMIRSNEDTPASS